VTVSQVSLLSPLDECLSNGQLVFMRDALKVQVDMGWEELVPFAPIMVPLLVVCSHHTRGDVVVCMAEKTLPMMLLCKWQRCHETSCGGGKREEKWVRKSPSVRSEWNKWEAKSAMWLALLGKWKGANRDAQQASIWRDRVQIRLATMVSWEERRLLVHATMGELSHPAAT